MGIKNFKTLLDKCPSSTQQVPLSLFKDKRVALDAGNLMIRSITSIWPSEVNKTNYPYETPNLERFLKNWLAILRRDVERFLINGVTPVYVFDGQAPVEKTACLRQRVETRERDRLKYEQLMSLPPQQVTESVREDIKKLAKRFFPFEFTTEIDGVVESIPIKDIMRSLLTSIGIPVVNSTEESERLCVNLCLEGYCSATFTNDRDALVHGCPIIITEFSSSVYNHNNVAVEGVTIIILHKILQELKLAFPHFVDLCIMLGCDYNTNIPNLGVTRSYALIKQFAQIEHIPVSQINKYFRTYIKKNPHESHLLADPTVLLNYPTCRKLFGRKSVSSMIDGDLPELKLNSECLYTSAPNFLSAYQLQNWISTLVNLYTFIPLLNDKDNNSISPPTLLFVNCRLIFIVIPYLPVSHPCLT